MVDSIKGIVKELINDLTRLYCDSLIIEGNRESTDDLVKRICTEACIQRIHDIRTYSCSIMTLDCDTYWECNSDISGEDSIWKWRDNVPVDIGLTE
jgi:hypothetical protein